LRSFTTTTDETRAIIKPKRTRRKSFTNIEDNIKILAESKSSSDTTIDNDSDNNINSKSGEEQKTAVKPKRARIRTKKLNTTTTLSSILSSPNATINESSPVRTTRSSIRSTGKSFPHNKLSRAAIPVFGVQDVLSLLYTYLPKPSTVLSSMSSSSLPPPVTVFDVHSKSIFNDFIIVVLCSSSRQMSYLAQAVYKMARARDACKENRAILSLERRKSDDWQMVDMGNVLLHVFNVNANITQPSLDYIQPIISNYNDDNNENNSSSSLTPPVSIQLTRHPVIDAIEKQFGDCVVPLEKHLELLDYSKRALENEEPATVNETQLNNNL